MKGAPLVPAFHAAIFRSATQDRFIVNVGGIANVTNQAVHNFSSFGTALRWKAVFGAVADSPALIEVLNTL